ncbi:MAG: isochorismate synthase [Thalassobius sp.]|nr:isochorismate synthase [Thalassovita sp.]
MNSVLNKTIFDKLESTEIAGALLDAASNSGLPIAIWKLPQAEKFNVVISYSNNIHIAQPEIENSPSGFIVSPFKTDSPISFIKADLFYSSDEGFPKEALQSYGSEEFGNKQKFWDELDNSVRKIKRGKQPDYHTKSFEESNPEKRAYMELVQKGVKSIKEGAYQKIVYSRSKSVDKPSHFHAANAFLSLGHKYPTAFVSLISLPEEGTWLGASPEILIEVKEQKYFRTIALAGTQARDQFDKLCDATWRQKEIEEQALVGRYIISCFKKIRLREFEEIGPKTVAAGSIIHLRTDYKVDMEEVNFPQLGSVMLKLLHPTSAVCGMPKEVTMQDVCKNEGYDRHLYSGYLGPVNIEDSTNIFVNLRCMQASDEKLVFYAGAGITEDSDAEKEFNETEMKMDILRKVVLPQD